MNDIIEKHSKSLNETIHMKEFYNGFKAYVVKKPFFKEKIGMITTNFGSVHGDYEIDGIRKKLPFGTAHFLEHKLFDDENVNIIDAFADNEGDTNAYTSFLTTSYFFSSNKFFNENSKILFDFVTTPYFDKEKIDKEKGIIEQEIKMYEDFPAWKIFLNMMDKLFENESYSINIAGRLEDIMGMNKEILFDAYKDFYRPNNMYGIFVGDIDIEDTFKLSENYMTLEKGQLPNVALREESKIVLENYVEDEMEISNTIFTLGFKEKAMDTGISKNTISAKLLVDIVFGESGGFYDKMYNKGFLDNSFNADYNNSRYFANISLAGSSKNPKELAKYIHEEINNVKAKGIEEERFLQVKKKHYGRFIREFNDIENIANILQDCLSKGFDFIDLVNELENIKLGDLEKYLHTNFRNDNYVLSVINPM